MDGVVLPNTQMARLFVNSALFINEKDQVDIMENDGMERLEDDERLGQVADLIRKGMDDNNVVQLYRVGYFLIQIIQLS